MFKKLSRLVQNCPTVLFILGLQCSQVTSRPTICLVNFVLSGKPVLLEQPRKGAQKLITHVLMNHAGTVPLPPTTVACTTMVQTGSIYLHCIPSTRNHVEDPPSISEGWGGRITDYRISVCTTSVCFQFDAHTLIHSFNFSPCLPRCRTLVSWQPATC